MPLRDAAAEVPLLANLLKTQPDYYRETRFSPPFHVDAGRLPSKSPKLRWEQLVEGPNQEELSGSASQR